MQLVCCSWLLHRRSDAWLTISDATTEFPNYCWILNKSSWPFVAGYGWTNRTMLLERYSCLINRFYNTVQLVDCSWLFKTCKSWENDCCFWFTVTIQVPSHGCWTNTTMKPGSVLIACFKQATVGKSVLFSLTKVAVPLQKCGWCSWQTRNVAGWLLTILGWLQLVSSQM